MSGKGQLFDYWPRLTSENYGGLGFICALYVSQNWLLIKKKTLIWCNMHRNHCLFVKLIFSPLIFLGKYFWHSKKMVGHNPEAEFWKSLAGKSHRVSHKRRPIAKILKDDFSLFHLPYHHILSTYYIMYVLLTAKLLNFYAFCWFSLLPINKFSKVEFFN